MKKDIETLEVTQSEAQRLVQDYKGYQFFTVHFVKRTNGQLRIMNCRKGVQKGLRGGALSFNPIDHNLEGVYDIPKAGHRCISLDEISRVAMCKKVYLIKN